MLAFTKNLIFVFFFTLQNDNHILKVIGVDRESSKKGEVKRILFKKGSESRGAILTECRRNRWLPINDQKREQIKEIKNLNNTKGILKISGLYVEKNKFTFHHKHFENTLPKFIQKAKEENKPIKIKTCMKETGKTIKRLIDKELHPKRLTPENLVVVKKYDAKKFLLFNMFGSSINKDSEFYGRIFWIKKLLCNANGARQIIIKFGFSILYSICLEDENLLKKEFPEEKDILGLLEKHMAAFRIIFLYNLLRKMIFQRDFSMDDFFKHFFWYKATLINEFVDKAKVYIEGRPYLRLTFNAELSEIFKDWHLQIKDFDIREGFLFQFHPDYISPFHLLKVIRNFVSINFVYPQL